MIMKPLSICLLLFLLLLSFAAESLSEVKLVYQGDLPQDIYYKDFKPANLHGGAREFIVVKFDFNFEVFEFTEENWKVRYRIPFADSSSNIDIRDIAWTIGDLNKNDKEEILICHKRTVKRYEWNGETFKESVSELLYSVGDVIIGDIDNDNSNELVAFCYDRPFKPGGEYYRCYLCVVELSNGELNIIWTDQGNLGYSGRGESSDDLVCIADVENIGFDQLLVAEGQSDMSATTYNLLTWEKNKLQIANSFILHRGTAESEGLPCVIGKLVPINISGQTMFIGALIDRPPQFAILKIKEGDLDILKPIFLQKGWRVPNKFCWIDLDGRGKGVLSMISWRDGRHTYEFYRF